MSSKLLIGSIVYGAAGIGCKVLKIENDALIIQTPNGVRKIAFSKVLKVDAPTDLYIGDRVTLIDKYMVRAGEVGTVEDINSQGIQIFWDIHPQPPLGWRTFPPEEVELIDRWKY
jgi:hypothetical protein